MRKQLGLGLVVEGNSTGSAVLRFPKLTEELGPIKSPALRVARRVSNLLRAGYAIADYKDLAAARLILLRVPDPDVPRVVDELCASELALRKMSFVLCESWLTINALQPLRSRGAATATLVEVPSARRNWFIVEGQISAVRQIRRVIENNGARAVEIRPGTKQLYFAAELLASALPIPLFAAAQQALRESGISGNRLYALLDEMVQEMFSHFLKGGRTTWGGPLNECSPEVASAYLDTLHDSYPKIAQVLEEQLTWARPRVSKHRGAMRGNTPGSTLYHEAVST